MAPYTPQTAPDDIPAEQPIDAALVRALLAEQRPELAGARVCKAAEGWDNALFRVGDQLVARLPRRAVAVDFLHKERAWLPRVAGVLRVPVPRVRHVGEPGCGYPWPWLLTGWLPGRPLGDGPLLDDRGARALGEALRALHGLEVPDDPPTNPFRGVTLRSRTEALAERLARLDLVHLAAPFAARAEVAAAPARAIVHGDAHPFNILADAGALLGLIDWGDLHAGDPAVDLSAAWLACARPKALLDAYGLDDDDTLRRAEGWALYLGVTLADAGRRGAGAAFERAGLRALAAL